MIAGFAALEESPKFIIKYIVILFIIDNPMIPFDVCINVLKNIILKSHV